jgi:membrane protein YdbS with pleckstrin-like domain
MTDSHPSVLSTSWDDWEHPRRAIAAIWLSVGIALLAFFFSLPAIFDSGRNPAVVLAVVVPILFVIPLVTVAVMARLD